MTTETKHRKGTMGRATYGCLTALADEYHRNRWYPGCGWVWGGLSDTKRAMKVLARAGYARPIEHGGETEYRITDLGRARAAMDRSI